MHLLLANNSAAGAGGAGAFEAIASATGTGSSGTITFSSIPADYQHLQIRMVGRTDTALNDNDLLMQFNSDTGSNYTRHSIRGNGSTVAGAGSTSSTSIRIANVPTTNNATVIVGASIIDIHDYASTTKNKTVRAFAGHDQNGTAQSVWLFSGLWIDTDAIDTITISSAANFTTQTEIALYGIKGA